MRIISVFFVVSLLSACEGEQSETLSSGHDMGAHVTVDADVGVITDMTIVTDTGPPSVRGVGYRETTVTYTPVGSSQPRELPIALWYPTSDADGLPALYYGLFERMDVFDNAEVALDEPAPVLLFSHGRSGFGQYSFFLTEHFARNGWIVASVDHIGDRLRQEETPADIYSLRPRDISALIDFLTQLPDEDPLSEYVSDNIALSGHSFGGFTTLAVSGAAFDIDVLRTDCAGEWSGNSFCQNLALDDALFAQGFHDPRVKAALPIAPGNTRLFGSGAGREGIGVGQIQIPTLLITGARDRSLPDADHGTPIWAALEGDAHRRVQFVEGGHFTFTSICAFTGGLGVDNGCDASFIPLEEAHALVNRYALAFLRRHFFGDETEAALLDGGESPHDGVLLERKGSGDE